jgi:hypothetical protein
VIGAGNTVGNTVNPATVFVFNSAGTVCTESWKDFQK